MLVTAENTRNDVWRPLNYENPPKIRRFSYQLATVGLPIVNEAYHAHDQALHFGAPDAADFDWTVLQGFYELSKTVRDS